MDLTSWMKMARFQTFWMQMVKNKPLDKSRKSSQTSGTKMTFYSFNKYINSVIIINFQILCLPLYVFIKP
ncbi:hypothetical protein Hanom_Chr13g01243961 [Helianthus anomalus]